MKKIKYEELYTLRKDGRYMGYYKDEKGVRHAVYDKDPEKLYQKLTEKERHKNRTYTFTEIAEHWEDIHYKQIRRGTRIGYNPAYKRAVECFDGMSAADISPNDVYRLLSTLAAQGYSAQTIKTQRSLIKQIYEMAVVDELYGKQIRSNPAEPCPLPNRLPKPEKREAPDEETTKLIRTSYEKPFGVYALLLISTGFRRGEALGLQWQDIDFNRNLIYCTKQLNYEGVAEITETKTAHGVRTVPLLPDLRAVLEKIKDKYEPTDYLFYGRKPSMHMSETLFVKKWKEYCISIGMYETVQKKYKYRDGQEHEYTTRVPTITSHNLRHGYATLLFEAGVDVFTAKKLLGHSKIETTMGIYTHLRQQREQESLELLGQAVQDAMNK